MYYRKFFRRSVRYLVVAVILASLSYTAVAATDDDDPLFSTSDLENELCARFRLKPKEIDALRPMIKLDNRKAAFLYMSASDTHQTNYMYLWEKVRRSQTEFASSLKPDLTRRQRAALKVAHSEFESRILTLWMDDYVELLTEALEMDSLQLSIVRVVFDNERERRHRLLNKTGVLAPDALDLEWESLTRERENELRKILSTDQLRSYRSLVDPPPGLIA